MSYGPPPRDQDGTEQPGYGEPPPYQGQAPGDPYGGLPGQPGAPGYGAAGYGAPGPYVQPPPSYFPWAITAAIFGVLCSLIFGAPAGFIATRHARQVRPLWEAGNQQGAVTASRKARTWAIVSTVLDVLGLLVVILIIVGSTQSNFHNPANVAASIKTQLQKRLDDPSSPFYQPGLKVTSVTCRAAGPNTDLCTDHFSNGQTASETAVISADGQSYATH